MECSYIGCNEIMNNFAKNFEVSSLYGVRNGLILKHTCSKMVTVLFTGIAYAYVHMHNFTYKI